MRICIVGGGKIGYYLAKTLMEHGHRPVLIELKEDLCRRVSDDLDLSVIHGDGTKPEVLAGADLFSCSALVAVMGRDENNLIACQLAKEVFGVKKTVARVNNPKNAAVLKQLGVDIAVSSTDTLARIIEREVETAAISQLMSLSSGNASIVEVNIPDDFVFNGQQLSQIHIPNDVVVVSVTRAGELIIPRGNTTICKGDKLMVLARNVEMPKFVKMWRLADK